MQLTAIDNQIQRFGLILLLLTIFAYLWFASTPLPLGGPNVNLASLSIFMAIAHGLIIMTQQRLVFCNNFIPMVTISLLLLTWIVITGLNTGQISFFTLPRLVIRIALGICMMIAVYLLVDKMHWIRWMLSADVLAVFVSSLFGLATFFIGDPFWDIWTTVATVLDDDLASAQRGRIAGLDGTPIVFSYSLAIAIPFVFALFLRHPSRGKIYHSVLGAILLILTITMIINSTRSMVLGVILALIIISIAALKWLPNRQTLLLAAILIIAGLLISAGLHIAGIAPQVGRIVKFNDFSAQTRIPYITTAIRYSLDNPRGTGQKYSPSIKHIDPNIDPKNSSPLTKPVAKNASPKHIDSNIDPKNSSPLTKPVAKNASPDSKPNTQLVKNIQSNTPHNQFFGILVYYGYPGLILLVLFHFFVLRSLYYSYRLINRQTNDNTETFVLFFALVGGLTAYLINSLFHNAAPFFGDWFYFIWVGLVLSTERILASSCTDSHQTPPSSAKHA